MEREQNREAEPTQSVATGARFGKAQSAIPPRGRRPRDRRRPIHRRHRAARAGARRVRARRASPMPTSSSVDTSSRSWNAGRSRRHHRPGSGRRRHRPHSSGRHLYGARWPADVLRPACRSWLRPGSATSASRSRSLSPRPSAQALDAAEAVAVEYRQLAAVSDVDARDGAGCAATLAGSARQHRARLGGRRRCGGRCSLCPRRSCRARAAARYAASAERHGAARGARHLRFAARSTTPSLRPPRASRWCARSWPKPCSRCRPRRSGFSPTMSAAASA